MCTSIVSNISKTIVGFNLDYGQGEVRVVPSSENVLIEIYDFTEGWMPLFGANNHGDFVSMPTCWPYDNRSNPKQGDINIINFDIDLLLGKRSFEESVKLANKANICSIPGVTFMGHHSNSNGDVLEIIPGQGVKLIKKPRYKVMTNFSLYKMDKETHPWMGLDRYNKANEMLSKYDNFGVEECFKVLEAVSQEECLTRVSIVFDVSKKTVHWCLDRNYNERFEQKLI